MIETPDHIENNHTTIDIIIDPSSMKSNLIGEIHFLLDLKIL